MSDPKLNDLLDEGHEILSNLDASIRKHGNYSPEATCTFIDQAGQCFREASRALAALQEPAPVAWLRDIDGTGSLHPASEGDPGSFPVYAAPVPPVVGEDALPLTEIRRRVRNIWGAISSEQVIDKDVEGQAKRLLADIDAALASSVAKPCGVKALPERDTSTPAEKQGLFRKFEVRRADGSDAPGGKHYGCRYFVLDVDHDPYAIVALSAYAAACESTHPALTLVLREKWGARGPVNASLLKRLRQYEGHQSETTACYNGLRDEAADVIAYLSCLSHPAQGWREPEWWKPMDSAPKDGSNIIVAVPTKNLTDYTVNQAYFEDGEWWFAGTGPDEYAGGPIGEITHHLPTHWMPLPSAPVGGRDAE